MSHSEERSCRFCFEATLEGASEEDMRLVSPCNCRGTSSVVHVGCLRRWQALRTIGSRLTEKALEQAVKCSVCGVDFAVDGVDLRPQIDEVVHSVRVGTLVVASENLSGEGRTFHHSVILICNTDGGRARGVDLTRKISPASELVHAIESAVRSNMNVGVFAGGPTCGGRFGVVQYVFLHTLLGTVNSRLVLGGNEDVDERPQQGLYCPHPWASYSAGEAIRLIESKAAVATSNDVLRVFKGHCAWGRGQLEAEIQQGNWGVGQGSLRFILDLAPESLWDVLWASGRLRTANTAPSTA